jgi:large subunit ribosomal protein L6
MSRVGLKPIPVPSGVSVDLRLPTVTVKGPKGTLTQDVPTFCEVKQEGDTICVTRPAESREHRAMHGLTRTLIANMVVGVSEGFSKDLEIVGVGYKAESKGKTVVLTLGFSHPINYAVPEGITVETPEPTKLKVSGIDKQKVGQVAAEIRGFRPPEPYKGKGVKYIDEYIQRKAGKTAVGGGG